MRTSQELGRTLSLRQAVCCACSGVLHWFRLRGSHSSTEAEFFPLTSWKMRTSFRHQQCDHRHSASRHRFFCDDGGRAKEARRPHSRVRAQVAPGDRPKVKTHEAARATFASWTSVQVGKALEAVPCFLERRVCKLALFVALCGRMEAAAQDMGSMESSRSVPICGREKWRDLGANGASARKEEMPMKRGGRRATGSWTGASDSAYLSRTKRHFLRT